MCSLCLHSIPVSFPPSSVDRLTQRPIPDQRRNSYGGGQFLTSALRLPLSHARLASTPRQQTRRDRPPSRILGRWRGGIVGGFWRGGTEAGAHGCLVRRLERWRASSAGALAPTHPAPASGGRPCSSRAHPPGRAPCPCPHRRPARRLPPGSTTLSTGSATSHGRAERDSCPYDTRGRSQESRALGPPSLRLKRERWEESRGAGVPAARLRRASGATEEAGPARGVSLQVVTDA